MLVESKKTVKVTLYLSEQEAHWLKDYMQNPFVGPGEYEGENSKRMREDFFTILQKEIGD